MVITIYTLRSIGISNKESSYLFSILRRYIQSHDVQLIRPVILKNKHTTTTITVTAYYLSDIEDLVNDRLINPRRSLIANWYNIGRVINMLRNSYDRVA